MPGGDQTPDDAAPLGPGGDRAARAAARICSAGCWPTSGNRCGRGKLSHRLLSRAPDSALRASSTAPLPLRSTIPPVPPASRVPSARPARLAIVARKISEFKRSCCLKERVFYLISCTKYQRATSPTHSPVNVVRVLRALSCVFVVQRQIELFGIVVVAIE